MGFQNLATILQFHVGIQIPVDGLWEDYRGGPTLENLHVLMVSILLLWACALWLFSFCLFPALYMACLRRMADDSSCSYGSMSQS